MRKYSKLIIFLSYYRRFKNDLGFIKLLKIFFIQYIVKRSKLYSVKFFGRDVFLRSNSTDTEVFVTILLSKQYPIFSNYDPKVIIDAGANIGLATIFFRQNYPNARIISIEPDQENCKLFKLNTLGLKNIYLLEGGLWSNGNCKLRIKNPDVAPYSFQLEEADEGIEAFSVETLIEKFNIDRIDLLKIDIEGAEREIFSKDTQWLSFVDNIIIEVHDHYAPGASKALLKAISNHGFNLSFNGENLIFTKMICKYQIH